jgi:NitT/TauT family transport system permease protein
MPSSSSGTGHDPRIWTWSIVERDIYQHLWVTLLETVLAFAIGTVSGP